MLSRGVYYYSRVLATTVGRSNIPCTAHRRSRFPATFSVTKDSRRFRRSVVFERRMASGSGEEKQQKFPPRRGEAAEVSPAEAGQPTGEGACHGPRPSGYQP
ncbi:hypothetical protein RHMOL_Rhmol07G0232800 [Rhododendron molle]|uniref:Uncharacterized protein n=1 Tax=Rhododendron molle TaxID=49168 RepID=A0ACC0N4K7_RHOML|nr:hypothetical protein RHMOL_Rhmol07G0232800 [Rhododendron molle]